MVKVSELAQPGLANGQNEGQTAAGSPVGAALKPQVSAN